MAEFNGQIITTGGRNLLSRTLSGEGKFLFTKACMGNQKHSGNLKDVTALKSPKVDLKIMNVRNDSGTAVVSVHVTNKDVTETFLTQEFGIFAKIEGDAEETLYAYTTAAFPDAFPKNDFGVTYESIHEVYMAFSSDIEADIYVKNGVIFITREIADEIYTKNEYPASGLLSSKSNLEKDKLYCDKYGNWFLNIGGNRSWNKSDISDSKMISVSFKTLYSLLDSYKYKVVTEQEIKNIIKGVK